MPHNGCVKEIWSKRISSKLILKEDIEEWFCHNSLTQDGIEVRDSMIPLMEWASEKETQKNKKARIS